MISFLNFIFYFFYLQHKSGWRVFPRSSTGFIRNGHHTCLYTTTIGNLFFRKLSQKFQCISKESLLMKRMYHIIDQVRQKKREEEERGYLQKMFRLITGHHHLQNWSCCLGCCCFLSRPNPDAAADEHALLIPILEPVSRHLLLLFNQQRTAM